MPIPEPVSAAVLEASATSACRKLAERLGLGSVEPAIVGRGSNLVIALEPLPIVARVATGTALLRDALTFCRREIHVASFLAGRNAPVARPCSTPAPGPHEVDGLVISLWERILLRDEPPDAAEAGRRLAVCHRILREYPNPERSFGVPAELSALLEHPLVRKVSAEADRAMVARQLDRIRPALEQTAPHAQTLHGDAHLTNVFAGPKSPLWADWEDTTWAPVEWDLACLVTAARIAGRHRERAELALAAYGPHDPARLDLFIHLRALSLTAWIWLFAGAEPSRLERVPVWLDWLRVRENLPG